MNWRLISDYAAYLAVRSFAMILQMFPVDMNLRTARLFGRLWALLLPRHLRRATENIQASFGDELTERQAKRMALKSMQHWAMVYTVEILFTPRLISEWTWSRWATLGDTSTIMPLLLSNRGMIVATGHYGNFELSGFLLATLGLDIVAVMRPLDNPYLNRMVMEARQKRGLDLLYKKGATSSASDVLKRGAVLAFIADQNAGHKGLFVDFFGRKASTYKSLGLLAMEHAVPIVVACARRRTEGRFDYELAVERIIKPEEWQGRDDPLTWITQEYTAAIESFVRKAPEQYLWVHRRWKSRPPQERAAEQTR